MSLNLSSNTLTHRSDLDGTVQTVLKPGAVWMARIEYPPLRADSRDAVEAFLAQLEGQASRITVFDFSRRFPKGTALGTPLVNGGNQTGSTLVTDGWQASQPAALKVGDWFSVQTSSGPELKRVRQTVVVDGAGAATIAFSPPLRKPPADNAAIVLADASCIMRLATDAPGAGTIEPAGKLVGVVLDLVESFTG